MQSKVLLTKYYLTKVCTNEKDILIQFCNGCFINGKLGVEDNE